MKLTAQLKVNSLQEEGESLKTKKLTISYLLSPNNSLRGFSSLATVAVMGLLMALFLGLVGTGVVKLPGSNGIPTSPIPISDPVEDDEACNDPFNAECEDLDNDPEDLTPAEIQKALEED